MKKIVLLLSCIALLSACRKDDEGFDNNGQSQEVSRISYTVEATYGDKFNNVKAAGAVVKLTDTSTGQQYEATTSDEGKAILQLLPGTYNIEVSKSLTKEQNNTLFGFDNEAHFSASKQGVTISKEANALSFKMSTARMGDLVIKQLYYTGSNIQTAAKYYDNFFEVHNNSSDTLYLDGIYFAKLTVSANAKSNKGKKGFDAEGKYDWSQAQGLEGLNEKANTDYVYAKTVIAFPGSGKEHPLAPGKSKIVAASARNHKEPIAGQPVRNPELTLDLSRAHFEVYLDPSFVKDGKTLDTDNPAVTNMVILHKSGGKDFLLDTHGREAYILFRDTKEHFDAYKRVALPTITTPKPDTAKYVQIPIDKIIDGVNAQHDDANKSFPHSLPNSIDAGELKAESFYSSEVFIRKVKDTKNGITRYQDTNNSTNDFDRKVKVFDLSALD